MTDNQARPAKFYVLIASSYSYSGLPSAPPLAPRPPPLARSSRSSRGTAEQRPYMAASSAAAQSATPSQRTAASTRRPT